MLFKSSSYEMAHIQISESYSDTVPFIGPDTISGDVNYVAPSFPIGPFKKYENNPILKPNPDFKFESGYLYNPTAIVLDGKVFLFYRAQDKDKLGCIGLAWSQDGYHFTRLNRPMLAASEEWEKDGGLEDPRVIRVDGTFYMTYTGYDLDRARLCLATSTDLVNWKKFPPMFPDFIDAVIGVDGKTFLRKHWSKAGAMFDEKGKDGKYGMIWGEGSLYVARSDNLINWETNDYDHRFADGVHTWENRLIEPGPAPIKTKDGKWILIYNGATCGNGIYAPNQYSVGQMLVDYENLEDGPLARLERPLLSPESENEKVGQVNNVCFCEGLVQFKGRWMMYYGQADEELGVATADVH
jgi:predicted GH43/DUF377 family glycosyl hydrolase